MTCSSAMAPIINLQQQLAAQNGFIPVNAIYDNFYVAAVTNSNDSMTVQATLMLKIANAPIYQFTINATLTADNTSSTNYTIQSANFIYLTAIYNNYQPFQMVTQDFQLNVIYGGASSFTVVYAQVESLNFYVAVYSLVNSDPSFTPRIVGAAPLLTLSYMYEAPGVNVFTNQYYPYHTYGPSSSAGQQIIFYNNSDSVLSFYYFNPQVYI
jgi:hypothetical protein